LALGDSSKPITGKRRELLIKSFLAGVVVTALMFFLLKDVEEGFSQVYIKLTVQALASCILGGVIVGLIMPVISFQAVAFHASLSTIVGSFIYFLIYHLVIPPIFPGLYYDIISNFFSTIIGGFVGGVAGSEVKKLIS
jgi:pilus assembly protein TadC